MTATPTATTPRLEVPQPIVPIGLLGFAVAALAIALAPDSIATAMVRALGRATSAETLAHWHWLQQQALLGAIFTGVIGTGTLAFWRRIGGWLAATCERLAGSKREFLFDCCAVLLVLGATHGGSLIVGQLRGDDYLFLPDAGASGFDLLLQPWIGHISPLWRLEGLVLFRAWALDSEPYRWWLFGQLALLCMLQSRVMAAWGLTRTSRLFGAVILCGWTQWAQITMGYWTLSMCVKVWIATWCAVLVICRDGEPRVGRKALLMIAALAAVLEDSSGAIVVPAVAAGSVAWRMRAGAAFGAAIRQSAWPLAVALVCAIAFTLGQLIVSAGTDPILGDLRGEHTIGLVTYMLAFGTVGALFAPVVSGQVPMSVILWLSVVIVTAGTALLAIAWCHAQRRERAVLGYGVTLLVAGLTMVVAARPYADYRFIVQWTHYLAFLYVPLALVMAVLWQTGRRAMSWSAPTAVQWLALGCAAFLGAQEVSSQVSDRMHLPGGRIWERRFAEERAEAMRIIRDSILEPLSRAVPDGALVPQLAGTHLDARFGRLNPMLPLSFYAALGDDRVRHLKWVTAPATHWAEPRSVGIVEARHVRDVIDPAFVGALRTNGYLRDTYFASAPLPTRATLHIACEATRRARPLLEGDTDRRHWLLLDIARRSTTGEATTLSVAFRTAYRDRAVYPVRLAPTAIGCLRLELLEIPELALSSEIQVLGVTGGNARGVDILGLFPPSAASNEVTRAPTGGIGGALTVGSTNRRTPAPD